MVDFLFCLGVLVWCRLVVCVGYWLVVGFLVVCCIRCFVVCGLVWVLVLVVLRVFWPTGVLFCLRRLGFWVVLGFVGLLFGFCGMVIYCCVPGLRFGVVVCLLGVCCSV